MMPFTRKLPKDCIRIVVLAGKEFRGVLHFEEATYDASDKLAKWAIKEGVARKHEDQR